MSPAALAARVRVAVLLATGALIAVARAHKPARRGVAKALVFTGGVLIALGVGLIFAPAGVIVAGIGLVVWALVIFDVGPAR